MLELRAGDLLVVDVTFVVVDEVVVDEDDDASFVDDSVEICVTFCDKEAFGVLCVENSKAFVVSGGLPEVLLTKGVDVNGTVDGVTKRVVDEGVGATEKGFGTSESMTPAIGPSIPISLPWQLNSSG